MEQFVIIPFRESREYTLGIFPHSDRHVGGEGDLKYSVNALDQYDFRTGTLSATLIFLMAHDLWETHPEVRQLYRDTPNQDTPTLSGAV